MESIRPITRRALNDHLKHSNSTNETTETTFTKEPYVTYIKQEIIDIDEQSQDEDGEFDFTADDDHTINTFIQVHSAKFPEGEEEFTGKLSEPGKSARDQIVVHCPTCNVTSEKPSGYKTRTSYCITCNTALTWCCAMCNRQYALFESARSHVRFSCGVTVEPLFCSHCNFNTTNKYNLLTHLKNVHSEDNMPGWHRCIRCSRQYKNRKHLQRHEVSCGRMPHIKCRWCGYKCKRNDHLTQHMKAKHPEMNADESRVMTYGCPGCSKKYKYKMSLKSHMNHCLENRELKPTVSNVVSLANRTI